MVTLWLSHALICIQKGERNRPSPRAVYGMRDCDNNIPLMKKWGRGRKRERERERERERVGEGEKGGGE